MTTVTISLHDDGNITVENSDAADAWLQRYGKRLKISAETDGAEDWEMTLNPERMPTPILMMSNVHDPENFEPVVAAELSAACPHAAHAGKAHPV